MEGEGLIRVTNYYDHPTEPAYKVIHFRTKEAADHFEQLLQEKNIGYERDDSQHNGRPLVLFGIHKRDFKEALRLNFLTHAKYRKPLIPDKAGRIFFLLLMGFIVAIAIWRYAVS
jgi:hypothetical protein